MTRPKPQTTKLDVSEVVPAIDAPHCTLTYADAVRTPSAEASKARFPEDYAHIEEGKV